MQQRVEHSKSVANASAILGVDMAASHAEVRQAWKRRAFDMHPDRGTGTDKDLVEINLAYEVLKLRASNDIRPDPAPASPAGPNRNVSKPIRPNIRSRTVVLSAERSADCRKALAVCSDPNATDHTANALERSGRRIIYTVSTGLALGLNRIALPTGFLVDGRSTKPVIVELSTATSGASTYHVHEDTLKELFPGAASVTIRFANVA